MRSERGVTLLETLLALAIGGLLLTAAATAVVRSAEAAKRATARTRSAAAARSVLLDMAGTVAAAAPRPFAAGRDWLRLALTEPMPMLRAWSVEDGALVVREAHPFAHPDAASTRTQLEGVAGFEVRCFDGGAWVAGWSDPTAPRAVELGLRLADGEALRTRVLLATGGGG